MTVSLCIPVHNEDHYLPYTMPGLGDGCDEVVVCLDHCTDQSEALIHRYLPHAICLHLDDDAWHYHIGSAFQTAFNHATGDIILAWAADLCYDPQLPALIREVFQQATIGAISFRYYNYALTNRWHRLHGWYDDLFRTMMEYLHHAHHTGVYALRRQMIDDVGELPAHPLSGFDDYPHRLHDAGWQTRYIDGTRIIHLRPSVTPRKQYEAGQARAMLPDTTFWNTIIHAILHLKPHVIPGYLSARQEAA